MPTSPMSTTFAPAAVAPSITAFAIEGEETRMSLPTAISFGSNCSTYARPIA